MVLPGGTQIVAADDSGFHRELPHELVAASVDTCRSAQRDCCCTL